MPAVQAYKVLALPGTPVADALYFVKGNSDTKFRFYITNTSGAAVEIDAVTAGDMLAALALKEGAISAGTVGQYWRGDKTWQTLNKVAVGLDQVDNTSDLNKPISTAVQAALNLKATDSLVMHLAGTETVTGSKTFSLPVNVATPTATAHATTKGYVDSADASLQTQINNLTAAVNNGMQTPTALDCSSNPNYPAANAGKTWKVTVAGKIGGASGINVNVNDTIVCMVTSVGGTQAAVGASYYIIEGNMDSATEAVAGYIRIATNAEALAGAIDNAAITPLKLQAYVFAKAVRFDASQGLSGAQQTQARANIGAADDSNTVHKTGAETIGGAKTFSSEVAVPTATVSGSAVNKAQMDAAVASAILVWGTVGW